MYYRVLHSQISQVILIFFFHVAQHQYFILTGKSSGFILHMKYVPNAALCQTVKDEMKSRRAELKLHQNLRIKWIYRL